LVHEEAVAEELTQDVFLKAYRGLGRFKEKAAFSTWLYRIALNHARDYRSSSAAQRLSMETSLHSPALSGFDPVSPAPGPDAEVVHAELAAEFDRCLEGLEPHLQEAFLLRHQESLSYRDIAEIMQITEGNAKVRVHRARGRIIEELRARGHDV
jgi:RNA polymerase sigma-70 factor (ECF subfamily)